MSKGELYEKTCQKRKEGRKERDLQGDGKTCTKPLKPEGTWHIKNRKMSLMTKQIIYLIFYVIQ